MARAHCNIYTVISKPHSHNDSLAMTFSLASLCDSLAYGVRLLLGALVPAFLNLFRLLLAVSCASQLQFLKKKKQLKKNFYYYFLTSGIRI